MKWPERGWPWGRAEWTDGLPLAQSSSCALAVPAQLCLGMVTILPQLQEGWGLGVPSPLTLKDTVEDRQVQTWGPTNSDWGPHLVSWGRRSCLGNGWKI